MDFVDSNKIIESLWPWLAQNGDNICSSQDIPDFCRDIRLVLKDNWSVLGCNYWIELVDKDKLVKIDLAQFYEMCHSSELSTDEIEYIKDLRRKAQKCRSSLKSQAKIKLSELSLEKDVDFLSKEKTNLQHELEDLCHEISFYKKLLGVN